MSLQSKTIQRYRLLFPNETLKEISTRTGIQITRVFRLFNGKPMKLREFEAINKAINLEIADNPGIVRLNYVVEEATSYLTSEEIGKIADHMERKVFNKKFSRTYISPIFEDANIA